MAWSWTNKGDRGHRGDAWSMEEQPKNKRRRLSEKCQQAKKVDEGSDDWGDDSLELTQAELETLDVMTSQVMSQEAPIVSTSRGEAFVKPSIPAKSTSNKSSSSSDSSLRPISFSSISSSSDTSSASLSSHSSSNGFVQSNQLTSLEALQSELQKKEKLIRQAQDEKYRHDGEVKYLRESLHKQEVELEKLRAARDEADDHQKEMQSEKEKNLQLQVEKLTSQSQFKEREYQELQQMVQTLQNKLKESERQGKISPSSGSHSQRLTDPEKAKPASPRKVTVKPSPPSKLKQQQQRQSLSDEDPVGSSQRQSFPTCSSFLETTKMTSPSKEQQPSKSKTLAADSRIQAVEQPAANPLERKKERRLKLNAVCPERHGNEVLRATIQPHLDSGKPPDPGLISLLHAMSTSLTLDSMSYSRLKDASLLSPLKPKRHTNTPASSNTESADSTIQIVSQENFSLAVQGLEILLSETRKAAENPRAKFFTTSEENNSDPSRNPDFSRKQTAKGQTEPASSFTVHSTTTKPGPIALSSSSSQTSGSTRLIRDPSSVSFVELLNSQHHQAGAVLLLPMLCDYLHHYVNLIHSSHSKHPVKTPNTTPVSTVMKSSSSVESLPLYTSSCSYDSSLDSLSSSVLQLLQDGRVYANAIERHAISALRCLNTLVQLCPVVTSIIVKSSLSATVSATASETNDAATSVAASAKVETSSSHPSRNKEDFESDADDEKSTSSSEIRIIRGINANRPDVISPPLARHTSHDLMDQSAIMYLVIGLAGEDVEDGNVSPEAVEESLRLMTQLCYKCNEDQIPVLENIIDRGVLSSVFCQMKHPLMLLHGQKLCKALTCKFDLMYKLCNKAENCPLYMMHRLCSSHRLDSSSPAVINIYIEYISFLSTMSLHHRNGFCSLVTNSCRCSEELVVSVILATHKLFALYMKEPGKSDHLLAILFQAILVLHSLAQGDSAFIQHQAPVKLTYVYLLSRMSITLKPLRSEWEWHVSALEELCDVEPELNESSQDSEGEDRMDVS